jgi:hypothetical protein
MQIGWQQQLFMYSFFAGAHAESGLDNSYTLASRLHILIDNDANLPPPLNPVAGKE